MVDADAVADGGTAAFYQVAGRAHMGGSVLRTDAGANDSPGLPRVVISSLILSAVLLAARRPHILESRRRDVKRAGRRQTRREVGATRASIF